MYMAALQLRPTTCFAKCALTTRSTDPPVRAFYLAIIGGGGPVNLVLLGRTESCRQTDGSSYVTLPNGAQRRLSAHTSGFTASPQGLNRRRSKTRSRFGSECLSRLHWLIVRAGSRSTPRSPKENWVSLPRGNCRDMMATKCLGVMRVRPNRAFNRTRRYGPSTWRTQAAAGRL